MTVLDRRRFIQAAAAAAAAAWAGPVFAGDPPPPSRKGRRRPNVVFLFADQLRACSVGCHGNDEVITPHLDALAAEGLVVTGALSSAPVCTPYRGQLLTGRYPSTTGIIHNDIRLPDDETTLGEVYQRSGYTTGYVGKWHLAGYREDPVDATNRRGWDYWAVRNCSHKHFKPAYCLNDAKKPVVVDGWEPDVQTDLAVEFIRARKQSPFCLFLSYGPPHNPYKAPQTYRDRYRDKKLTPRPNAKGSKNLLDYHAMTTSLDDCVGRIVAALKEAGVAEDTILCFSSDHGDMLGSHGQRLKQRPWEESINIPFILRYPRAVAAGQRRDWLLTTVDVMPSLLGLCGIDVPKTVQGFDWSAGMRGEKVRDEPEDAFLYNVGYGHGNKGIGGWRGLRTKRWTYAMNADGDWLLYDLQKDPYQQKNLIKDRGHAKVVTALRDRVEAYRQRLGDDRQLEPRGKELRARKRSRKEVLGG